MALAGGYLKKSTGEKVICGRCGRELFLSFDKKEGELRNE